MGDKGEVAMAVLTAIVAVWLEAIASVGCESVAVVVGYGHAEVEVEHRRVRWAPLRFVQLALTRCRRRC
jgi:hypothetical protein